MKCPPTSASASSLSNNDPSGHVCLRKFEENESRASVMNASNETSAYMLVSIDLQQLYLRHILNALRAASFLKMWWLSNFLLS